MNKLKLNTTNTNTNTQNINTQTLIKCNTNNYTCLIFHPIVTWNMFWML